MAGCAGQGNLLRYPSVLYNNYDLQWFIPYLLAVVLIAIPALILEVSIGQAYRGGTVIAFNNINRRLKGVGMGPVIISFLVVQYFTVNLAWIMNYFRWSFTSSLPWENPSTARNLATTSWTVSIDGSQRGFDLRRLERGVQRDDSVPMA
jgi:solute carrier family 6 GABA transporter-like protein 1